MKGAETKKDQRHSINSVLEAVHLSPEKYKKRTGYIGKMTSSFRPGFYVMSQTNVIWF